MKQGLICAYDISTEGIGRDLSDDTAIIDHSEPENYRWLHWDLNQPETKEMLHKNFDSTIASALTADDTRPRCERHNHGIILILRGVNLNPGSQPEDMVSIRLWITQHQIISVQLRQLMAVTDLRNSIEQNDGPRSTNEFLFKLIFGLTEYTDDEVSELADTADTLEDKSLETMVGLRTEIAELRRSTILLRRHIAPQREALNRLIVDPPQFIDRITQINIRETLDHVIRMIEELDAIRERAALLTEQLTDKRSEEMNRNMMILSVVAAIFLPLSFLTGLLGVNIGGIPGATNPLAFTIFCLLLILVCLALLVFFRKLKWI